MLEGGRIFHVNINCSDLARSRRFYLDDCGLVEGVRTTPEEVQSGAAFGLDRARWDAEILVGTSGFDGGAIDLLQWIDPPPIGAPPAALDQPGFQRIGVVTSRPPTGRPPTLVTDPDGVTVELIAGDGCRLAFVAVVTSDLPRSVAFYRALGFRPAGSSTTEVRLDAPAGGEVQLVLVGADPATAGVRPAGTSRAANTLGMWRLALLVPDLDRVVASLRHAAIELVSDPQSMSMGPGLPELRFVCFRGPDGEVIELIEAPEPT